MKELKRVIIMSRSRSRTLLLLINVLWIACLVFSCYLNYRFVGNSTLLMLAIIITWFITLLAPKSFKNIYASFSSSEETIKYINDFFDEK